MRQRLKVWFARLMLTVLAACPLVALTYVPIKHSHQFWPYGHVHSVFQGVAIVASYGVLGLPAAALVVGAAFLVGAAATTTVGWLWAVALRRPHKQLWQSWSKKPTIVRYDKPTPLVRGRLGSR